MGNKSDSFRAQRSTELHWLCRILDQHQVFADSSPLYVAAERCRTEKPDGDPAKWGYSLTNLLFHRVGSRKHVRPPGAKGLVVALSIRMAGSCDVEERDGDPLSRLEVNFEIHGVLSETRLLATWHLDRHQLAPGDNPSEEGVHPLYHFHFGGRKTWDEYDAGNLSFGSALFLDPPRLPHPPLDAVLGIDFLLSNFDWTTWNKLIQVGEYRNIVRQYQERFWLPYAQACATWPVRGDQQWSAKALWPQIDP